MTFLEPERAAQQRAARMEADAEDPFAEQIRSWEVAFRKSVCQPACSPEEFP